MHGLVRSRNSAVRPLLQSVSSLISTASIAFQSISTPAAILEVVKMNNNMRRMQAKMTDLGVKLRPHAKTAKCVNISQLQIEAGACGATVSTLKEAETLLNGGITDILYAVGIVQNKLPQAHSLMNQGCNLKLVTDNVSSARAIRSYGLQHGVTFQVMVEIDTDGHRAGIGPDSPVLLDIADALTPRQCMFASPTAGALLAGVMTHAGGSYYEDTPEGLLAMAERERSGCVWAAERLRAAGYKCPMVSTGSTPTAVAVQTADQVQEMRPGVYIFMDLVMHNIGVCALDDIALSVLTSVIGHQPDKGWVLVDAGWMAMSRDKGVSSHKRDFGYGLVCALDGTPVGDLSFDAANQEHGVLKGVGRVDEKYPIGTQLRILPNHACATAAAFSEYHLLQCDGSISGKWSRINGW